MSDVTVVLDAIQSGYSEAPCNSCRPSTLSCTGWPRTGWATCAAWTAATSPTVDAHVGFAGEPPCDYCYGSDTVYQYLTVYACLCLSCSVA
jgi:hypothetical protein